MSSLDLAARRRLPLSHAIARWGLAGFLALGSGAFAADADPQDPAYRKLVKESFEGISPLEEDVYQAVEKLPAAKRKAVAEALRKAGYVLAASNAYISAAAAYPDDQALQVDADVAQGDAHMLSIRNGEAEHGMPPDIRFNTLVEALQCYGRALAMAPDRLDVVRGMVEVTLEIGATTEETVKLTDRLLQDRPDDVALMALKARATLDALKNGMADADQAHLKGTQAVIEQLVKAAPKEPSGHALRCRLYLTHFQDADVATIDAIVNAAMTQCPDDPQVLQLAGNLAAGRERWALLGTWSQKLIGPWSEDLTPMQFQAIDWHVQSLHHAMAAPQGGDRSKPMVSPEFGLTRVPPTPKAEAAALLGTVAKPAVKTIDQAIIADPTYAKAWYLRAQADFLNQAMARGIYEITQALALDPKNADYYRLRGDFFLHVGSREQFLADYRSALKLMPANAADRPTMLVETVRAVAILRDTAVAGAYAEEIAATVATNSTDSMIPYARMLLGMHRKDACAVFAGWYGYLSSVPRNSVAPRDPNRQIYEAWLKEHQPKLQLFEAVAWLIADPTNSEAQALVVEKGGTVPKGFTVDAYMNFQRARLAKQDPVAVERLSRNGTKEARTTVEQLRGRIAEEVAARRSGTSVAKPLKAVDFDDLLIPPQVMSQVFEARASWHASHERYADASRDATLWRIMEQLEAKGPGEGAEDRHAMIESYIEVLVNARERALTGGDTGYLNATAGLSYFNLRRAPALSIFEAWYGLVQNAKSYPDHAATKLMLAWLADRDAGVLGTAMYSYANDGGTQDQARMRAIADYQLALDPQSPTGLHARGYEYYKAGRTGDAMAKLDAVIAINRSHPGATLLRGRLYLGQNRYPDALVDLAIATTGDFSLPLVAGDRAAIRKAEGTMGGAVKLLTFYREKSSDFYKEKQYRAAAGLQLRALKYADEVRGQIKFNNGETAFLADAYYFIMLCFHNVNDFEAAAKYAELMFKTDPNHANAVSAYNTWLSALNYTSKREEQERVARIGIQKYPQSASFWVHLGYSMAYRKRTKEAKEALDKALQFSDYSPDYYYYYANAMESAEQDAVAIEMLTKALQKAPADWSRRAASTSMLSRLNTAEVTQLASGDFGARSKVTLPPQTEATEGLVCEVVLLAWDHKEASVFEVNVPNTLLNVAAYDRIDQRDDHLKLVMMGKEIEVEARLGRSYRSDSGMQLAYELKYPDNTVRLAVNGVLSQPFRRLNGFTFADDDNTWLAAVQTVESPNKATVLLSGDTIGAWDSVTWMQAADGNQAGLLVKEAGKVQLVVKGEAMPVDGSATQFVMTRDASHYSYTVKENGAFYYVYDGTPIGPFDSIAKSHLTGDGRHMWALAINPPADHGGRITYTMIVDGAAQLVDPAVIDGDRNPQCWISNDASGWVIHVKKLFSGVVCHNGALAGNYKNVSNVVFSDDGTHIAFQADVGGVPQVVVDGADSYALWPGYTPPADKPEQKPELKRLIMSPDGRRVAWSVQAGTQFAIVERGTLLASSERLPYNTLNFSADSRNIVFLDIVDGKFLLRIEDKAWRIPYNNIITALVPNDAGGVRFIAFNVLPGGRRVFQRVEVPLN